jgi:hypothetical protein
MCISTLGCSAFQFDEETGACDLGSKAQLRIPQPSDSAQQLTKITVNPVGKTKFFLDVTFSFSKSNKII